MTKTLSFLQDIADYHFSCPKRSEWLEQYVKNRNYVDGNQWQNIKIVEAMNDIGMGGYSANKINTTINKYEGLLNKAVKRISFSPSTSDERNVKAADSLKKWALNVQTNSRHLSHSKNKIRDWMISGIGASNFYFDGDKYSYDYVNPVEIYPDPDDTTPDMGNQNCLVRTYYKNYKELEILFPEAKGTISSIINSKQTKNNSLDTSKLSYPEELHSDSIGGMWVRGNSIRIVEVYYKKPSTYYECYTINQSEDSEDEQYPLSDMSVYVTFSEKDAKEKSIDGKITKKKGSRIYRGIYTNTTLLENGVFAEQVPNQRQFPIILSVFSRVQNVGRPKGIIDDWLSIQDAINYIISTLLHYKDKLTILYEGKGIDGDNGREYDSMLDKLKEKVGLLKIPSLAKATIIEGVKTANINVEMLKYLDNAWSNMTGMHDEYSGFTSRETSGVAIQNLTINTSNNQSPLILAYDNMIVSEGELMLDTLKGTKDLFQAVRFYNQSTDAEDIEFLTDGIRFLNFEIYPEPSNNFSSTFEEEKAILTSIFNSPTPDFYLQSPFYLQTLGLSEKTAYRVYNEWERVRQRNADYNVESQQKMLEMQMSVQMQAQQMQQPQNGENK